MITTPPLQPDAPALDPELAALIDRGVLSRAEGELGVDLGAWLALSRELVTTEQAAVLGQMLGLRAAA